MVSTGSSLPAPALVTSAMVPSGSSGPAGMLARLEPVAIVLPSLQREPPPVAMSRSPVRPAAPAEIIDISDDEGEVDWDLLEKEINEAEKEASQAGEKEAKEEGKKAADGFSSSLSPSSSSDGSGAGYCISFCSGRPQMKHIHRFMRRC